LAIAVALSVLIVGCDGGAPAAKDAAPAAAEKPVVEAVTIGADGPGGGGLRAAGMVAYQREAMLSFRTAGLVRAILVDEGDVVRQGQTLARLDLADLDAAVAEARTGLRTAENQLARDKSLFDRGFISQARLDAAELAVARARAGLTAISFNRDQAVITAPSDGVILRRLAEPNQNVAPGAPILSFGAKTGGLVVRAGLSGRAVQQVSVGDRAEARLADGKFREAKIVRIAAASNPATNAFDVEAQVVDAAGLRSGQVAELVIFARQPDAARLSVPASALLDARADQGVIYVLEAGDVARRRSVRTAGVEGEQVIIAQGVAPGERIVVSGAAFIRDGQEVQPKAWRAEQ
jgi:RND family efflux transporter MFP subunit